MTRHQLLRLIVGLAALGCLVEAHTIRMNSHTREESHAKPIKASRLPATTAPAADDLCFVVGQPVTLRGIFSLRGKLGPFVMIGHKGVYLIAERSFSWGPAYERMEGKWVTLTGTLLFFKAPPVREGPIAEARPPDHYYMEAESARVQLVK